MCEVYDFLSGKTCAFLRVEVGWIPTNLPYVCELLLRHVCGCVCSLCAEVPERHPAPRNLLGNPAPNSVSYRGSLIRIGGHRSQAKISFANQN